MSKQPADMVEVFSSIQGEGLLVGLRQVFLRFSACNLACEYCDTFTTNPVVCQMEATPGRRDFIPVPNPVSLKRIASLLDLWQKGWPAIHHSISLTGGEPLLHFESLREWLPVLRSKLPIYLETNGTLPCALHELMPHLDYISMDIKLPSTSGHADLWKYHLDFLEIAAQRKLYVKTVIGRQTEDWEIRKACELIASVDPNIPLILQPVTSGNGDLGITALKLLELQESASSCLTEVRIIPQTHKFLGMM